MSMNLAHHGVMGAPSGSVPAYVLWNPNDIGNVATLSNGDHTVTVAGAADGVRGTLSIQAGEHKYWEVTKDTTECLIGVALATHNVSSWPGGTPESWAVSKNGYLFNNGGSSSFIGTVSTGTTLGISYDDSTGVLSINKNGTIYTRTLTTGVPLFPIAGSVYAGTQSMTLNGGDSPFVYSLPSGASALFG